MDYDAPDKICWTNPLRGSRAGLYCSHFVRNLSSGMSSGVVTLGQLAARLSVLDVACNRCERRGRLRTGTLLARHGPALPVPALRGVLAADCPRLIENRPQARMNGRPKIT
jgi:hypothetical protein